MSRHRFRSLFFGNLFTILAAVLGVFQVLIGHWVLVVFAGREGPGPALGLLLAAAATAAAEAAAMPSRVAPSAATTRQSGRSTTTCGESAGIAPRLRRRHAKRKTATLPARLGCAVL